MNSGPATELPEAPAGQEMRKVIESTGATKEYKSETVNIGFVETSPRRLHIAVGACKLFIRPCENAVAGENWVSGSYHGPTEGRHLQISQEGGTVKISQRHEWDELFRMLEGVPTLELTLGKAMPYELVIDTGASESYLDFGALPITHLVIKQGAGKVYASFSTPNTAEMDRLFISTGASSIEVKNLLNANTADMRFEGGAASYKLEFGGVMRRSMNVNVSAAMSSVELLIPASIAARITSQTLMGAVNVGDGYLKNDGEYLTEAAVANLQPVLTIHANVTLGSLNLRDA